MDSIYSRSSPFLSAFSWRLGVYSRLQFTAWRTQHGVRCEISPLPHFPGVMRIAARLPGCWMLQEQSLRLTTQTHVHRHVCWLQAGCPSSSPSQNFNYIIETITLLCQKVPPLHVDLEWSIPLSRILNLFLPHLPLGQCLSCRHLIAAESFGEMFWNSKLYWTGLKTFQDFALRWEPKSPLALVACWNESPRLYSISSYSLNEMSPILA